MKKFIPLIALTAAFILFTIAVKTVDVQPAGPLNSQIGFATVNTAFHDLTGYSDLFYKASTLLGFIPFAFAGAFTLLGFTQLCSRRSFLKVDLEILTLGAVYILTILIYICFEKFIVNFRPVLMDQELEASYPSSHTFVSILISLTAIPMFRKYIGNNVMSLCLRIIAIALAVLIPFTRLMSGVHWLTDIAGGIILSFALEEVYRTARITFCS